MGTMTMRTTNGTNTHNGHEFVDLGLPSRTLWATCNVGATSPEQAGLYFAFGETKGFTAEQVKKGERSFFWKDYVEKITSSDLSLEQDAAHVHMGGEWRMPTKAECQELLNKCNVMWTKNYNRTGVAGKLFTSKVNGNSVFFPAVGYCYNSSVCYVGSGGDYWSSTLGSSEVAWYLYFYSVDKGLYNRSRYYGYSVRGVCKR